jgi:bromodomain-containing protein 7/9
MDFSTMKAKIDGGQYHSVAEYRADYQCMMENCMQYNHPDTVYHREAKRLLSVGLKHMSREQLLHMKRNLPSMSGLTHEEIGLDDDATDLAAGCSENKWRQQKERTTPRRQNLSRFEAIPDKMSPEEILRQAQEAAKAAADKLALRAPNSKIGFLRRRDDGSTSLNILNPDNSGIVSDKEKIVSLGELVGKLTSGTGNLTGLKDDRRNKVNPVNYLSYGVFSSYAPIYDSSSSNLSKEDSDLLLATYGDEAAVQYAKSLRHFVANCGDYAIQMVDNLLDILTDCEHSKTNTALLVKERERLKLEQEEAKKKLEMEAQAQHQNSLPSANADESSGPVSESQRRLDHLSTLIAELHRMQNARLSQQMSSHLGQAAGPSAEETELANKVSSELAQIVKQIAPKDVASLQSIRGAMGIASEPLPSTASQMDQQLDKDCQEFFVQGVGDTDMGGGVGVVNLVDSSTD